MGSDPRKIGAWFLYEPNILTPTGKLSLRPGSHDYVMNDVTTTTVTSYEDSLEIPMSSQPWIDVGMTFGIYEEYISIDKKKTYLMMIGDGINKTIITGNHNDDDGWKTFNSATFGVKGDGFVGVNIIFRNTAGPEKHQAVAALNSANMSSFYSCSFEGYQDTLYAHSKMQL
ncbi:probable pectinesterase/pectinesterase inhibitor 7 [Prosopis cineraria]|uniref:probable pectinesterase/pectinesterase inhibitor 7 n=1 Tax=Prosopis cineraria TaxID=364024 RepID=UPI00240EE8B6|nr:probable pectinesterase/pectinesterase inhibitor 7 [Prosopis cineraria]